MIHGNKRQLYVTTRYIIHIFTFYFQISSLQVGYTNNSVTKLYKHLNLNLSNCQRKYYRPSSKIKQQENTVHYFVLARISPDCSMYSYRVCIFLQYILYVYFYFYDLLFLEHMLQLLKYQND